MDWIKMLNEIFQVCVVPLLGILTYYLVAFIKVKAEKLSKEKNNDTLDKYLSLLTDTVTKCVIATNQTYVNDLKNKNAFDAEAQKNALKTTQDAVMAILSEDAKTVLTEVVGDLNTYVNNLIEAAIKINK